MPDVRGRDYRALRRLSDGDNLTLANIGETCERVPPASLAALIASGSGKVERLERRTPPRRDRKDRDG